ncbi:Serine/threonine-protein kinase VPS15 [Thalictrum thalictroides]|uniref:non-specific serine/threonine protein kinase n=1 Tax=Thalictrum thalictroides TaxID=46969 RepID=A0A7J6V9D0_THATH|nr:Serine/threonine-protein kinase VPS15 [Thalictrum thalictroides]
MGNKIARTTQASASEYYLHDLPSSYNLVLKEVLGRGRFLKSIQCKHDEGLVLVKVYFKRGDSIDLKEYERRLFQIREIFRSLQSPHVWPFQYWLETDKAAYLLRQYVFNNLHDRLSTRPFLNLIEKKWLAFQLLYAVKQSHENGVCHGDIKCENVLVTSWNWLYLADFASFKPTYIPHDDPSDFSFFFDTGGRRRCYLAPERFYEHGSEMLVGPEAPLSPPMDIFSVGCVIAELFLEGQPLFELSQLLAYRRGQYDPNQILEKIPDAEIRKMILHMIQLDPESRLSAESYLQSYETIVFPCYFSPFLHNFFSYLIPLDSDTRVAVVQSAFHDLHKKMMNKSNEEINNVACASSNNINSEPCQQLENATQNLDPQIGGLRRGQLDKDTIRHQFQLLGDITMLLEDVEESTSCSKTKATLENVPSATFGSICAKSSSPPNSRHSSKQSPGEFLKTIMKEFKGREHEVLGKIIQSDLDSTIINCDNQSDTSRVPCLGVPEHNMSCEGMVLIASLLCSCIRSVKLPQLRRSAVLLLKFCSFCISDEDRLQRVLPYVIAMLSDPAAIVRCAALETLCEILPLVRDFPPSDAKIFPEYILPMLSMLPDDPEESVRICYASNISKLALTAYRFLIQSQSLTEVGVLDKSSLKQKSSAPSVDISGQLHTENSDLQLSHLRKAIAEVVQEVVMGPKQTPNIRRALLQDISNLCCFFGQKQSNDFLLPILPAFLNDRDEQLRAVFFGKIVFVCFFVGQRSVEEYLLPYIEQALSDTTEAVIVNTLECLAMLCKSSFLRKRILLDMIERSFPLLCYPSQWVRRFAVTFIAASSENLGAVDSYVYLAPVIRPFVCRQPASLASEKSLLSCLKPPVSRQMFYQVLENARSSDMLERQRKIWYNSSMQSTQQEAMDMSKRGMGELSPMLSRPGRQPTSQDYKSASGSMQQPGLVEGAEVELRPMGSFIRNCSSAMDIRDTLSSEKLHFSGFISPHVSGGTNFDCDGASEGIPVYSFSVDKRAVGATSSGSDSSSLGGSVGTSSSSMLWMDQSNKSFSLASSAPKLVPGSFSISNGSKQLYKVKQDLEGRENSQTTSIGSKFQDLGISGSRKGTSTITIDVPSPTDIAGMPSFVRPSSVTDTGWRPRGVLVGHLQEHQSAVNDITISNDHCFFVSASNDSTVKIWDTRKLEKDISFRSRLTYPLHGSQALCTAMLRGSAQIVVGASDGAIHTFSVDYISRGLGNVVEKYSGVADIKKREIGEGSILNLLNYSTDGSLSQMVMYSTQSCGIHLWDTRADSTSWTLRAVPEEGYVSSLVTGQCGNWFVSGTSRGVLTLWDLRFLVPVNSWKYSQICPIEKMCLFIPSSNTSLSVSGRPLVYVAAGCNEVSLWNAENGSCHQVLRLANNDSDADKSDLPWALVRSSSKSNSRHDVSRNVSPKYRVEELNEPPPRVPGIRSFLPLPGGDLLTGGTDLRIRRWDHSSPGRSYSVCGPSLKGTRNEEFYETRSSYGVQVVQESNRRPQTTKLTGKALLTAAASDSAGSHRDCILSLASVKLNQRLLISSSRDGAIKVWK